MYVSAVIFFKIQKTFLSDDVLPLFYMYILFYICIYRIFVYVFYVVAVTN